MGRILYLQCDTGISGDMVVGALLDAGADEKGLVHALRSLEIDGYDIRITRKKVGALVGCDFDVVMDDEHQNHDHDMEWLYGSEEPHASHHGHDHGDHHHHAHRNLGDIRSIVEHADVPEAVRSTALSVFTIIAEAEARAHGETVDTVHFHEVGAVDSIVDVMAVAWCLDDLGIEDVVISPLAEGEGHVRCAHGILPIPVPAVTHIVEAHGLVLRQAHRPGELVTPTGAAIAAAIRSRGALPECYRIIASGIGCGKRAYDPPSSVKALLVEDVDERAATSGDNETVWKLETEVDDCAGEALGYVLDRLYQNGALEAHFLPVFMKKGRPGYQIEVLCEAEKIEVLQRILFEDTTTIGIRRSLMHRSILERACHELQTKYGPMKVKEVRLPNGETRVYPEHDSVAMVAREQGVSYQEVMRTVLSVCESCQQSTT